MKKVLFIATHRPDRAPSQRFRFEQYLTYLHQNNFDCKFSYLFDEKDDKIFYSKGKAFLKVLILLKSVWIRVKNTFAANQFDIIFIQREALVFGPPLFEWLLSKSKAKIIFDFDDSIWLSNVSQFNKYFG